MCFPWAVSYTHLATCSLTQGCTLLNAHEGECILNSAASADAGNGTGEALPNDSGFGTGNGISAPENEASLDESAVITVDTADKLRKAVLNALPDVTTTIQITANLTLDKEIATNKNIVLTSDGSHTITFSSMQEKGIGFNIYGGGSLTIGEKGNSDNALTIIAKSQTKETKETKVRCLVNCYNSCFVLNSGELKSDAAGMDKGVVCLTGESTFEMHGGSINGASQVRNVWLENSAFTMYGGEITAGKAENQGGGIYLNGADSHFVMNGGSITQCEATYNGGGVALMFGADFTMNDRCV